MYVVQRMAMNDESVAERSTIKDECATAVFPHTLLFLTELMGDNL